MHRPAADVINLPTSMGPDDRVASLPGIPECYRDIPIVALGPSTRAVLGRGLDVLTDSRDPSAPPADYRGLAELMGADVKTVYGLERARQPTLELLSAWRGRDVTLFSLCRLLLQLGRLDVLTSARSYFNRDADKWLRKRGLNDTFRKTGSGEDGYCLKEVASQEVDSQDIRLDVETNGEGNPLDSITVLKRQAKGENSTRKARNASPYPAEHPAVDKNRNLILDGNIANGTCYPSLDSLDLYGDRCDNVLKYSDTATPPNTFGVAKGEILRNRSGRSSTDPSADDSTADSSFSADEIEDEVTYEKVLAQANDTLKRATRERTAFKRKRLPSKPSDGQSVGKTHDKCHGDERASNPKASVSSCAKNCQPCLDNTRLHSSNKVLSREDHRPHTVDNRHKFLNGLLKGKSRSSHGPLNGLLRAAATSEVSQESSDDPSCRHEIAPKPKRWPEMCRVKRWCHIKQKISKKSTAHSCRLQEKRLNGAITGQCSGHVASVHASRQNGCCDQVGINGKTGSRQQNDLQPSVTTAREGSGSLERSGAEKTEAKVKSPAVARRGHAHGTNHSHSGSPCLCYSGSARRLQQLIAKAEGSQLPCDDPSLHHCDACSCDACSDDDSQTAGPKTAHLPSSEKTEETAGPKTAHLPSSEKTEGRSKESSKRLEVEETGCTREGELQATDNPACLQREGEVPGLGQDSFADRLHGKQSHQDGVTSTSGAPSERALYLMRYLSVDDVTSGRETHYDAYLNCADADISVAKEMLTHLEAAPYSLRFFLPARQLLPGLAEFEAMAEVVERRCCGKVVILVSENYEATAACQFVTHFARLLDPAALRKQLVPVLLPRASVPRLLRGVYHVDLQRDRRRGWLWDKLCTAIKS